MWIHTDEPSQESDWDKKSIKALYDKSEVKDKLTKGFRVTKRLLNKGFLLENVNSHIL